MSELTIQICDEANAVITRLVKDTTLSRGDIISIFVNEGFNNYFFENDYEDFLNMIPEYVKVFKKRKQNR